MARSGKDAGRILHDASPEAAWLQQIGSGSAQTDKVCARGSRDRVARALCANPRAEISSLRELHALLGIDDGRDRERTRTQGELVLALTANSLSLVARSVSALNPRVIVGRLPPDDAPELGMLALGFARGEPFVELFGNDVAEQRLNFYLLVFEPTCEALSCTPAELLGESIEHGWKGYTLYQAEDLVNTPLDCLSCHEPEGPGGERRLLMRQLQTPWTHWMPSVPSEVCDDTPLVAEPALFSTFLDAHGADGHYAGFPPARFAELAAGQELQTFVATYQSEYRTSAGEPYIFPSAAVLGELSCGAEGERLATWTRYRQRLRGLGLPVPFYTSDVLDEAKRDAARADYPRWLNRAPSSGAADAIAELMSAEAAQAIGLLSSADEAPEVTLREMCVRCHNSQTDRSLSRSRFDVEQLDRLDAEEAALALERLALPDSSPLHMPPRRFGTLSSSALVRVSTFLSAAAQRHQTRQ